MEQNMNRFTRLLIDKILPADKSLRNFITDIADFLDSIEADEYAISILGQSFEDMAESLPEVTHDED